MHIDKRIQMVTTLLAAMSAVGCGPSAESQRKADSAIAAAKATIVTQAGEILSARREGQMYFDGARTAFVTKRAADASQALRDGAAFTRRQSISAASPAKEALVSSADELEKLASRVRAGTVKSVQTLDYAFARTQLAEAQLHCTRALSAWRATDAAATATEIIMLVDHFERAAADAAQPLAPATQQTLDAARSLADKLTRGGSVVPLDVEATLSAMDKEVHSLMTKTAKLKG
jgi:hypothetical protein